MDWAYPGRQKALDLSGAFCFLYSKYSYINIYF